MFYFIFILFKTELVFRCTLKMEEINKRTLIESLSSLPEHEPPENIWERIETEMENDMGPAYSRQDLRELPTYGPPSYLWDNIEKRINGDGFKIIPIGMRRAMAVAASLVFLLGTYWFFNQNEINGGGEMDGGEYAIGYSTEIADDVLFKHDWNEDETAFEEFNRLCEVKKFICEQPEFQILKSDLDELTEAKFAIQEAIGNYGTDAALVIQIKEIELERTDILKKMMVMLI